MRGSQQTIKANPSYHPIRDITTSTKLVDIQDVDPELVVLNVDHTKNYVPAGQKKPVTAAAVREEMSKKRLSMNFGAELLEKNGWGSGTRLPFASIDNQQLEKILEKRQRKFLDVQTELIDNNEHIKMLEENFNRATQDITAHQTFLLSKKKQLDEEKDLLSLSERLQSRIMQDRQSAEKTLKDCQERCERMETNQAKRLKNLCELRDLIEFDRESLKEYHERLKAYQNQKFEIGRIIDEDTKTVEQIDKMYVELGASRKALKMELDQQAMATSKSQEQLDRLSMEFRRMYKHRQEMLQLWSTNIENAKRKDVQMLEVADDYFDVREQMRDLKNETQFRERQFKQMQCSIRNTQFRITEVDKKVAEIRRVLKQEKEAVALHRHSITSIQQDIRASSFEKKNILAQNARLDSDAAGIQGREDKVELVVQKLRKKLKEVTSLRSSSDNYINELEKILDDEQKRSDVVIREIELVRKYFWERSNDKKGISNEIANLEMNILRYTCNLASLEAKEFSNMEYLARQSGKIYRMDLECSTLENKISHAENESVNPKYFVISLELTDLKNVSKNFREEKKYITKQVSYLDRVISKNGAELAKHRDDKQNLDMELLQINMLSQRTQKYMTDMDKEFQDLQVMSSLESVNLKRLTDALKRANDQLFGLSEQRKTICCAVSERRMEIENNQALNGSRLKALRETTDKLKVQIKEIESRTEKFRGRFELITKMMMDSNSDGSEEQSVGYRVRKAARERESLSLELRKWEKRIEEAKQELAGLENVQKLLHVSNKAVKEKLTPINEGSTEAKELEVLDHEEKSIHVRKCRALRFKLVLSGKIEDLNQQIANIDQETQATVQLCKMKTAIASKTENELFKQKEKVQRWNNLCLKLLKEIKPIVRKGEYDVLQQDLKLKLIQEKLECALNMLDKLILTFPHHLDLVYQYLKDDENLRSLAYRIVKAFNSKSSAGMLRPLSKTLRISGPPTAATDSTRSVTGTGNDNSVTNDTMTRSTGDDEGTITTNDFTKSSSNTEKTK